jgi:hypothetical protein
MTHDQKVHVEPRKVSLDRNRYPGPLEREHRDPSCLQMTFLQSGLEAR